jgi:phytoene dehydrogenase-like protein
MQPVDPEYDVVVIGSGLAGLTGANQLGKWGHRVLLLEQHSNFGGLATWFKRRGGHIFDISLHGFPYGMKKSCRKYWNQKIVDSIVQLPNIRLDNPQYKVTNTFEINDLTRLLVEQFQISRERVEQFFRNLKGMEFYSESSQTTRELFQEFFPGRGDVHRLLMEPITYANSSTLDDPAITYGIVFSNFLNRGAYTFKGGTDNLIREMQQELERNGVHLRNQAPV